MSDEKALALRLAEFCDGNVLYHPAAAELRRLHWDELRVREHRDTLATEITKLHEEIQSLRDRLARQKVRLWVYRDNPGLTTMSQPSAPDLWEPLGPIV